MTATGRVSSLDAVAEAIEHTRKRLFPFDLVRWIMLGFVCFLDQCGRQGGGGGNLGNFPSPGGGGGSGDPFQWIQDHLAVVVAASAAVLVLILAITAAVTWLSSRGIMMYVEAVGRGVVDVEGAWQRYARLAWSLFLWRFGLAAVALLGLLALVIPAIVLVAGGIASSDWSGGRVGALVALGAALVVGSIASNVAAMALRDFVAPIQMGRDLPCGAAIAHLMALVAHHPLAFAGYALLKLPYGVLVAMVMLVAGCGTCCLGFLPVISQTLLQPLHAFERSWSLCLLRQAGIDLTQDVLDPV
jgi:hypothetical protein